MIAEKSLSHAELQPFGGVDGDYSELTRALLRQQKSVWEQLASGYESLETVRVREFRFEGFTIKVQFNPGRIISSSAKVDEKSIKERKCFLCIENLPADQKGIAYKSEYLILCNPFPIFPEHYTIPNIHHVPQRIDSAFGIMLDLSKDIGKYYTVFYNGPKCGASAPDHLHFQAGNKGFMLIEEQFDALKLSFGETIHRNDELEITAIDDSLRRFIGVESADKTLIEDVFKKFYTAYTTQNGNGEEPMMNIISFYIPDTNRWRVLFIPRGKHRPSYYFLEGDEKLLLSPASVDYGGILITPLEKDFKRLSEEHIRQMFGEVSLDLSIFQNVVSALKKDMEEL